MAKGYAFDKYDKESMSRAIGRDLPVSTKQAIEICNFIRKMDVSRAMQILEEVQQEKRAIPFKRFTNGLGHRRGKMSSGRYPKKASENILSLLKSAEVNAQQKGLNTANLIITHICANRAAKTIRPGRRRSREMKKTHIEVVLAESSKKKQDKRSDSKPAKAENKVQQETPKKEAPKSPAKTEEKKEKPKQPEKK